MNPYVTSEIVAMRKVFTSRNAGRRWNDADYMRLRLAVGKAPWPVIARQLGRSVLAVSVMASILDITGRPKRPTRARYVALLSRECDHAGLCINEALSKSRRRPITRARWAAWAELRRQNYSLPGIGMAAGGYDHTAILHGVRSHNAAHGGW